MLWDNPTETHKSALIPFHAMPDQLVGPHGWMPCEGAGVRGFGVEVGRSSGEPQIPEAQLQPTAPVSEEQEIDAGILVAGAAGAETSYVRLSVATKPSLAGEEDFRLYPLEED